MKKVFESAKPGKNEEDVFSRFSEKEILSLQLMSGVRGGDGDGDGGDPVIIIPPKPKAP